VLLLPERKRFEVDRDQAGDERPVVAYYHDLADQRMRPQPVFEHRGGDVLAAGRDDQFLLAAGHGQEALVVARAKVTRMQPAVAIDGLGGRRLLAPLAAEHAWPAHPDLALLRDPRARCPERQA